MSRDLNKVFTTIAGVDILWQSDCVADIEMLRNVLHHHIISFDRQNKHFCHKILFVPARKRCAINRNMDEVWVGNYLGCFHEENKMRWLYSPSTNEDLILISDEIWIEQKRNERHTICHLLCDKVNGNYLNRPTISDAIIILIHTTLAMYRRYTIHAAAVEIDGRAHVFLGESGHGKSTLCTDLVVKGAKYLGDDLVFLYTESGRFCAGSLLIDAKLFSSSKQMHKSQVDIIKATDSEKIFTSPIESLYYIERTSSLQSSFKRMTPIDAMVRLMHASNNIRMQYDAYQWQSLLQNISLEIPYYLFFYGTRRLVTLNTFRNAYYC